MKPETQVSFWYTAARAAGAIRPRIRRVTPWPPVKIKAGISVVIPSRNGKDLLAAQMPGIVRDLDRFPSEIIVVDNGSNDGTADWLGSAWPEVLVEISGPPLSFARAVNRGIALARYSHVCLLNNDMILEPDFFAPLRGAFDRVPGLFSATAQIFFPPGVRREETGKAVYAQPEPSDFPIRCDEPVPGEDLTYVLYGSGGCTLYDASKLRALGSIDPAYEPVYVEDLDIGYRAWQKGWPSVYVAGARLEHRHRTTSARYFTEEQLEEILEINYLRFVARAVASREVFRRLWLQALDRLRLRSSNSIAPRKALRAAVAIALGGGPSDEPCFPEDLLLALSSGGVAVFPGHAPLATPRTLLVGSERVTGSETHLGGVIVTYVEQLQTPRPELLATAHEVVQVRRSAGPLAFRAALQQTARKWSPAVACLIGEEMAEFAPDCAPARPVTSFGAASPPG